LFDVESQIFVTVATRASLGQISVTPNPSYSQFCANIPKLSLLWQQASVWGNIQGQS